MGRKTPASPRERARVRSPRRPVPVFFEGIGLANFSPDPRRVPTFSPERGTVPPGNNVLPSPPESEPVIFLVFSSPLKSCQFSHFTHTPIVIRLLLALVGNPTGPLSAFLPRKSESSSQRRWKDFFGRGNLLQAPRRPWGPTALRKRLAVGPLHAARHSLGRSTPRLFRRAPRPPDIIARPLPSFWPLKFGEQFLDAALLPPYTLRFASPRIRTPLPA